MFQIISRRLTVGLFFIFGGLMLAVPAAQAGGWAVITLDQLPTQVVARQPVTVGFMIYQHGHTPMEGLAPQITAVHNDSKESFVLTTEPQGQIGHYVARLTFPQPGAWQWSIQAFTMDQPMPVLTVLDAVPAATAEPAIPSLAVGLTGLISTIGAALVWWRKRVWWTTAFIFAGVIISVIGFASTAEPGVEAKSELSLTQVQLGHDLFMAKGCIVCHAHKAISEQPNIALEVGPNLTNFPVTAEYLHAWLKNPSAVKPNTQMPNLRLHLDEIEALTAFLLASPAEKEKLSEKF